MLNSKYVPVKLFNKQGFNILFINSIKCSETFQKSILLKTFSRQIDKLLALIKDFVAVKTLLTVSVVTSPDTGNYSGYIPPDTPSIVCLALYIWWVSSNWLHPQATHWDVAVETLLTAIILNFIYSLLHNCVIYLETLISFSYHHWSAEVVKLPFSLIWEAQYLKFSLSKP